MDIKNILRLNKSLLGGTALLGLGSIAAGVLAGPVFGALANFAAGMVANNLGALVDKLRDNRDVLRNQDLAKAAALAITLALGKISPQYPKIQGQLEHLATQTEAYWLQWEEQAQNLTLFESVREEQLVNIFAQSPEEFSQYQVLRAEEWRDLATWLFEQGCQQGALLGELADYANVINTLAQELQLNFNKNLREVLKDDAANGGEAFAGMLLDLHGKTLAQLDNIEKEFKEAFQKLATREDICQALERVESGIHQELQEIKAMLVVVLELLHQRGSEEEQGQPLPDLRWVGGQAPPLSLPCPYLGLSAFGKDDQHLFFGRDALIQELVQAVEGREIVPVIGPSGSGKSSVVFAGLLPELEKQSGWLMESLRPKNDPLHELARALLRLTAPETELQEENLNAPIVAQRLRDDPLTVEKWLGSVLERHPQTRIVLVIDQFEEVFTTGERSLFLERVLEGVAALNQGKRRVTLLFTMRADFMENALSEPRLAEVLDGDVKVKPMGVEQLRAIIERPAQGLVQIQDGLTERILEDALTEKEATLVEQAGCLPLVEFALKQLWDAHERGWLTHEAYEQIGGVKGAIAQHAEAKFQALKPEEQDTMRQLFIQLVYPGVENRHTRKIVTSSELGEQQWSLAQKLAQGDYRLVVTNRNEGTKTVELIHEALIREWERFQEWIKQDWEFRRWQEQLEVERKLGDSLQGKRLIQAEYWLQERRGELSKEQQKFIRQSIEQREKSIQEREKQRRRVLQGAVAVGGVMTVLAAAAGLFGWQAERRRVEAEVRADALVAQRIVESRPLPALTRAIATTGKSDQKLGRILPLVQSSLAETVQVSRERHQFQGHQDAVRSIAITPDGSKVISGRGDKTLRVWDITTGESLAVLEGHQSWVNSIAITPDGSKVISGSRDNTLRVWDIATGESLAVLEGHQRGVTSIAITPDGSKVISGSYDKTLRVLDIATGESLAVLEGHDKEISSIALTPDGSKVVSGSWDNTLRVWDINTGESLAVLEGHQDEVWSLAITPDGSKVISGSRDNTVRVWDISTGESLAVLKGHQDWVGSIAITPDGSQVISGSGDSTLRIWDLTTGEALAILKGHQRWVNSIAIGGNGLKVISGSGDSTLRVWDINTGESLAVLKGHQNSVSSVTITPDGSKVISNSASSVRVWDVSTGKSLAVLEGHQDGLSIAITPDGSQVISGSMDGSVQMWDLATGKSLAVMEGHQDAVFSIAITPDGSKVISGSADGTLRVWDMATGKSLAVLEGHQDGVTSIAITPDGSKVISGSYDNTLRVWDMATGESLAVLEGHQNSVYSIAITPDGSKVISGTGDMRVWDIATGESLAVLEGHQDGLSIAITPDGSKVISGSADGTLRVWDIATGKSLSLLAGHQDAVWSLAITPDGSKVISGSRDNTLRVWDIGTGESLAVLEGHQDWVRSIAITPDRSKIISGSADGTLRVWPATWQGWLEVGCDRLRLHSSWVRASLEPPSEEREMALEAVRTCEQLVWSDRSIAELRIQQGLALAQDGEVERAQKLWQEARRLDEAVYEEYEERLGGGFSGS